MNINRIVSEVALLTGAQLPPADGEYEYAVPSLADRVRMSVEDCAARAILKTEPSRLTGWRLLPGDGLRLCDDGSVTLPLPDDYLMLHSLRLAGWEREVTEALPPRHWLRSLQGSRWHGLRGVPQRPLAFEDLDADGSPCLRLFSHQGDSEEEPRLESGWYMPRPSIDRNGDIDIPTAAYPLALKLMAGEVTGSACV